MQSKKEKVDGVIDTTAFVVSRITPTNAEGRQQT